jgi:hypothetical protein
MIKQTVIIGIKVCYKDMEVKELEIHLIFVKKLKLSQETQNFATQVFIYMSQLVSRFQLSYISFLKERAIKAYASQQKKLRLNINQTKRYNGSQQTQEDGIRGSVLTKAKLSI